jgi:regulator of sirC expression with transglutaminase-like and TPR domain
MNALLEQLLPPEVSHSEFEALTRLLDDTDATVASSVRARYKSYGGKIVPALRALVVAQEHEAPRDVLIGIVREFQQAALEALLRHIQTRSEESLDVDLEHSVILLSQFGYPETDPESVRSQLDALALRVHALFIKSHNPTDLGLLLSVNQAFFEEAGFHAALEGDYYNPNNSFIHTVLASKRGIPISLSVLYMLVAERAGITLHGIGMPAHFVVFYPELDVYIDAFNNGAFLTEQDCQRFIVGSGFVFESSMLGRVSNLAIILRMLRNLIFSYTKRRTEWEVQALQEVSHAIIETMNQ